MIIDAILTVGVVIAIFQISNRNKVGHHNVLDNEVSNAGEVVKPLRKSKAAKSSGKSAKKGGK